MGTHPIFGLTDKMSQTSIMPTKTTSALGLSSADKNTAGRMVHPADGFDLIKSQDQHDFKLAMKTQGKASAIGLRMERVMIENKPRMPGRQFRSLGAEILADRHNSINIHDFLGETDGAENYTTFAYPI